MVTLLAGQRLVVTRMDTLKIRLDTLCLLHNAIPYTTLYYIYANLLGTFFEKSGEIRVRDSCARKRVEYRF